MEYSKARDVTLTFFGSSAGQLHTACTKTCGLVPKHNVFTPQSQSQNWRDTMKIVIHIKKLHYIKKNFFNFTYSTFYLNCGIPAKKRHTWVNFMFKFLFLFNFSTDIFQILDLYRFWYPCLKRLIAMCFQKRKEYNVYVSKYFRAEIDPFLICSNRNVFSSMSKRDNDGLNFVSTLEWLGL